MPGQKGKRGLTSGRVGQGGPPRQEADSGVSPQVVIGIGAAAGGLGPLQTLLAGLPTGRGLAVVIVQHQDAGSGSLLSALIADRTAMTVVEATDGIAIAADHVYVMPADRSLAVIEDSLSVREVPECRGLRMPIDHFLCTLAATQGRRAVGVLLSGTGIDGTHGLAEIKALGGVTAVQDPATAQFAEMPQNALAAGHADIALPAERIAAFLLERAGALAALTAQQRQQAGMEAVLAAVRHVTGHDFHCYKHGTLERRIRRRMGLRRMEDYDDYARIVRADRDEAAAMRKDLLIGVTEFFRQAEAWRGLEDKAVADLVDGAQAGAALRMWVPACASGKEAYSLAMLLVETIERSGKKLGVQLFATDADPTAVEAARRGYYAEDDLKGISQTRLRRFFLRKNGRYEVVKQLRELIVFAPQDLTSDPPFSKLDLISCRNLLIYLDPSVQKKIIQLFHFALHERGYLFLGSAETISGQENLFEPVSQKWRIYRKLGVSTPVGLDLPLRPTVRPAIAFPDAGAQVRPTLPAIAHQALADRFGPPAAVVDRKGTLLYLCGGVEDYLQMPPGEQTGLLADTAREGLRNRLASAVLQAVSENKKVTVTARVKTGRRSQPVKVSVSPLRHPREADGLLLVTFEAQKQPKAAQAAATAAEGGEAPRSDLRQLEDELKITREELSSTIEQLEQSNEHLKASNEEVTSANEELQSANEELETSKEELQSLNEELNAVNQRLQEKVIELELAGNDVANLLTSGGVATIFLDRRLQVRRFTPAVTDLLSLIDSDIGRPIGDITRKFQDDALLDDARRVLVDLTPATAEVQAEDGRWFLRRILPYRTKDDRIEGVVITFADVTDMKELTDALRVSEEAMREAHARAAWLARFPQDNPNPVLRVSADGTILYGNPAAAELPGWQCKVGEPVPQPLPGLVGRALAQGEQVQIEAPFGDRTFLVWAVPFPKECYVNVYGRDITERLRAEGALRKSEGRYRELVQNANSVIIRWNRDGTLTFFNEYAQSFFGYSAEEAIGKHVSIVIPTQESTGGDLTTLVEDIVRRPENYVNNVNENVCRDGRRVWMAWTNRPILDQDGNVTEILAIGSDITARKRAEQEVQDLLSAVRQEKERLSCLLASISDEVWFADTNRKFTLANPAAVREFGLTCPDGTDVAELAGSLEVFRPDGTPRPVEEAPPLRALAGEVIRGQDEIVRTPGTGQLRHRQVSAAPVRSATGEIIGSVSVVRDVTEQRQADAMLRQSQERYRTLFDTLLEGFCIIEVVFDADDRPIDYRFLEINPAFEAQTGLRNAKGKLMRELAPEHEEHWFQIYGKVALTGAPARFVNEAKALNRRFDVSAYRVGGADSRKVAILFSDITERMQAEESLKDSERRERQRAEEAMRERAEEAQRMSEQEFRSLAEAMPQIVWATRPDGWNIYFNQRWVDYTGMTMEESHGHGWNTPFHPDDKQHAWDAWQHATQHNEPYSLECRLRRADGVYRWWLIRGSPMLGAGGEILKWFGTCTDIEEIKRAEAQVKAERQRLFDVLETLPVYVVLLTPDYHVPFANRFFEERFGKSGGRRCYEYLFNRTEPCEICETYKVLKEHRPQRWEWTGPDGRVYDIYDFPFTDSDGGPMIMEMGIDITEQRKAEAALREANETLERRVADRTAELERSNEDLQHFAYIASHDLQEPLRMVSGFLKLLVDRYRPQLDDKAREYIDYSVEGATRMSQLIADLLAYSRVDRKGEEFAPVDAGSALAEALANLRGSIEQAGAQVTWGPLPTVWADGTQLMQLLQNLVGNAIKFRSDARPCQVHVAAERREGRWVFSVRDNGIGVEPRHQDRIFVIFQRLHNRQKYPGTGVGLAICKRIVERHGGRIWLESKAGEGSTFFFTMPAGRAAGGPGGE